MSASTNAWSYLGTTPGHRLATVLILAGLTLLAAGQAWAQTPRPQATAQASSPTPYQAYLAADCPAGSNFCRFVSGEVPALKRLEIDRVACQGWHVSTTLPSFVVIAELRTSDNTFVQRIDFLKTTYAPANGGSVWAIGEQTLMFVPAGHKLQISLNSGTTGVGSYGCTISGYLTTAG